MAQRSQDSMRDRVVYINSESGTDDGPGTESQPFATFARALAEQSDQKTHNLSIVDAHPMGSKLVWDSNSNISGNVRFFGRMLDVGPFVGLPVFGERQIEDVIVYTRGEETRLADLADDDWLGIAVMEADLPQFDPQVVPCWICFPNLLTGPISDREPGTSSTIMGSYPGVLDVAYGWGLGNLPRRGDSFMIVTPGTRIEIVGEVRILSNVSAYFNGISFSSERGRISVRG